MKKKMYGAAAVLLCVTVIGGCGKKATPQNLLADMAKNAAKTESVSGSIMLDMGMGTELGTVGMKLDMDMESMKKPEAMHMQGKLGFNYTGVDMSLDLEMYELKEDGQYVVYASSNGVWTKEASEEDEISFQAGAFNDLDDMADSFTLSEEKTEVEGKECFELKGEFKGEDLGDLIDPSMLGELGAGEGISEGMFDDVTIPCTLEIYSKTILPARITMDMSDALKDLGDETASIERISVSMTFKEYDKVKEIKLPEEAKNAQFISDDEMPEE